MKLQCALTLALVLAVTGAQADESWGYYGEYDPSHWGELEGNELCGTGQKQSPIDITGVKFDSDLGPFTFTGWDVNPNKEWDITNNGHSATVTVGPTDFSTTGGALPGTYDVMQFHFHWGANDRQGSEHTVGGGRFPMEMHIVHGKRGVADPTNVVDGLAVLGVFFEISDEDNEHLKPVIDALPKIRDADTTAKVPSLALSSLLPDNTRQYYRYEGSLTTPGCNEVVMWTLFRHTVNISRSQLSVFRTLMDPHGNNLQDNFRPTQALNGREIWAYLQE